MSEETKEPPAFTVKKKVDESWKETVSKEKTKAKSIPPESSAAPSEAEAEAPPEANFEFFISNLGMQAVNAIREGQLEQARYLIDTLQMLEQKTKGNLTLEQAQGLQEMLYQLQLQFVKKSQHA